MIIAGVLLFFMYNCMYNYNLNKSDVSILYIQVTSTKWLRPDIVLYDSKNILVLELTVCHKSNLLKSKQFKLRKYENISKSVKNEYKRIPISVFTIEVSVLGFISDIYPFLLAANLPEIQTQSCHHQQFI